MSAIGAEVNMTNCSSLKSEKESHSPKMTRIVRDATPEDAEVIMEMITELAVYEKMVDQVKLSVEELKADLSGERPWGMRAKVAKLLDTNGEQEAIGYALYFFRFDDLTNRRIVYMEDLYVKPVFRGIGVGMTLWRAVAQHGLEEKCSELQFAVLEWNKTAIDFYEKVGAFDRTLRDGVRLYRSNLSKTEIDEAVRRLTGTHT